MLFNEHGIRYTELARLRYFDIVKMSIIDPMHCILLGTFFFKFLAMKANPFSLRHYQVPVVFLLGEPENPKIPKVSDEDGSHRL